MNVSTKHFLRWLSALFALSSILHFQTPAQAATNIVLAGEDLQTRINAAAAGDVMVVQSGTYGGDITVNKPLAFVRSGTNDLVVLGPVAITSEGSFSINQIRFAEPVTISGNGIIKISESEFFKGFGATGGHISARKTYFAAGVNLTNASFVGLRITNNSSIRANATANSGTNLFLTQSTVAGPIIATGYTVHMAYCNALHINLNDGDGTFVGNVFRFDTNGRRQGLHTMVHSVRSTVRFRNNDLRAVVQNVSGCEGYGFSGFHIDASEAVLENNLIEVFAGADHECVSPNGDGVYVTGESSKVSVVACIVTVSSWARPNLAFGIRRLPAGSGPVVTVNHCCINAPNPLVQVSSHASLLSDPGLSPERTLAVNSPCRNAGPPDAIYNDRDGTRNDIGFTGGPLYNPANFTTDLPLAFWLDTTPRKVLKGVNNTIRVDAAAVAGQ